jgi:hypothetical protein
MSNILASKPSMSSVVSISSSSYFSIRITRIVTLSASSSSDRDGRLVTASYSNGLVIRGANSLRLRDIESIN